MKSLKSIILGLVASAIIGNSQEYAKKDTTKERAIPQEKIEFYYAVPSFDFEDRKVKLAECHNYRDYVSMIDPEARAVKELTSKIDKKGSLEIAKEIYNTLKAMGIKYIYDPGNSKETFWEQIALEDELSKLGKSPIEASLKDYVKHPEQTLKHKGGDCEDLAILYSSLLLSKRIQAGLIMFQNHVVSIFKIDEKENKEKGIEDYLKDEEGNYWLLIDLTSIDKDNFTEALQRGYKFFLNEVLHGYRVVFNANYVPVIFEKQIVKK
ncbi:MAG: hypothetical protein K6T16_01125 [Candidatus Pacearchaeota archaeon]|nr:hypothetical protein [Candidatus Pacearchaeota archaeon]